MEFIWRDGYVLAGWQVAALMTLKVARWPSCRVTENGLPGGQVAGLPNESCRLPVAGCQVGGTRRCRPGDSGLRQLGNLATRQPNPATRQPGNPATCFT